MQTDDLTPQWPHVAARVEVLGHSDCIFLHDDQIHAVEYVCSHAFANLWQGFQEGGLIECPLHAARFEIAIGKCLNEIGQLDIRCFPRRVTERRVKVRVREREEAPA